MNFKLLYYCQPLSSNSGQRRLGVLIDLIQVFIHLFFVVDLVPGASGHSPGMNNSRSIHDSSRPSSASYGNTNHSSSRTSIVGQSASQSSRNTLSVPSTSIEVCKSSYA